MSCKRIRKDTNKTFLGSFFKYYNRQIDVKYVKCISFEMVLRSMFQIRIISSWDVSNFAGVTIFGRFSLGLIISILE